MALSLALCAALLGSSAVALPVSAAPPAQPEQVEAVQPDVTVTERIEAVVAAARAYIGFPYRIGSEGPNLFDCSGLVFRAFADAGQVARIGGARVRAAGYQRWFADLGRMVLNDEDAARGDLVMYGNREHIGIYLGDGRVVSALTSGIAVHSLRGITLPVTGYLKVDWEFAEGGNPTPGNAPVPGNAPAPTDAPETPASLVPNVPWIPVVEDDAVDATSAREADELVDMRTANTRTFANADGTLTTEFHARPIFFRADETEAWQPIDLSFAASDGNKPRVSVAASPVGLALAETDAADGFLALESGEHLVRLHAADARGAQTPAVPVVSADGSHVDYFGFRGSDVGLRVFAREDGFKGFIVLAAEPQSNRFSFAVEAPGLTLSAAPDGSIALTDEAGTVVGRVPRPLLLDSSDTDGRGGGVYTAATALEVDTDGDRPVVTITVDRRYLDEAVYPAYLDLAVADFPARAAGADMAFVSGRHPNATFDDYQRPEAPGYTELWHGRQAGTGQDSEVYVRFDGLGSTLGTVDVASASLDLFPYWQADEAASTAVRAIAAEWSPATLTWNTRPGAATDAVVESASSAGDWSSLDVSAYAAAVVSQGAPDFGLALSATESEPGTWKRFVARTSTGADLGPRLSITWSGLRPTAAPPAEPQPLLVAPTLTWTHAPIAPAQARFEVQVSADDFATLVTESGVAKGRRGTATEWAIPDGVLADGRTYAWRVRVKYGDDRDWSPWSAAQTFSFGALKVEASGALD